MRSKKITQKCDGDHTGAWASVGARASLPGQLAQQAQTFLPFMIFALHAHCGQGCPGSDLTNSAARSDTAPAFRPASHKSTRVSLVAETELCKRAESCRRAIPVTPVRTIAAYQAARGRWRNPEALAR